MVENDPEQAAISKFLAQNMADNLLYPMMERQRRHNMNCIKTIVGSVISIFIGFAYGFSRPYGDPAVWHGFLIAASILVLFAAIPIGIYGWMQRHYLERLTMAMHQIVINNS